VQGGSVSAVLGLLGLFLVVEVDWGMLGVRLKRMRERLFLFLGGLVLW